MSKLSLMSEPQGKKEVIEQVVAAALISVVTGLITWGIDALKEAIKKKKASKDEPIHPTSET